MDTTFKLDLKTLIMIVTFATGLAGVYYSFQSRLDATEYKVESVKTENVLIQKRLDNMDKRINRLKKNKTKSPAGR
jgi:tetrahydromethanopterin S-methyltransferase subunit G